VFRVFSHHLY